MKKFLNIALAGVLALGAVSCERDAYDVEGNFGPIDGKKMTFTIPNTHGGIVYSIATDEEKDIDMSDSRIYMFNSANKLEAVITDIMSGTTSGKSTATIDIESTWSGNKKFYFVGNASAAGSTLDDIILSATETSFLNTLTESQGNDHLDIPLLFAASESITVADIQNAPSIVPDAVNLYRSVARFDIDNNVTENKVEITEVIIGNANLNGYVFGYAKKPAISTATRARRGDLPNITVAPAELEDEGDADSDMIQKEESLFYLYPTILGKDGLETQISLVGKVGGVEKVFRLRDDLADIVIEANKRYKISAVDTRALTFSLVVADWDEADEELVGRPGTGDKNFGVDVKPAGTAVESINAEGTFITLNNGGDGTVSFTVKASSTMGTTWELVASDDYTDHTANFAIVETKSDVVTYGAPYFASSYEVTIDELTATETSYTTLIIRDAADPKTSLEIAFWHVGEGSEEAGKILINEITFPDAAFRDYVETTLGLSGSATPEQFAAVTEINVANNKSIKSLAGVEYFTGLTKLAAGGTNVSSLDASGLTALEDIDVSRTCITSLDVSSCTALVTLLVNNNPGLSSLNVSNCAALETLHVYNCDNLLSLDASGLTALTFLWAASNSNLKSLDVSGCTALEKLWVDYTSLTSLDTSDLTDLQDLKVNKTNLTSLNLSGLTALKLLTAHNCPELTSLNISGCSALTTLNAYSNPELTSLNVSGCAALGDLRVQNSSIASLDVTDCVELDYLGIRNTNITDIDLSANTKLTSITVSNAMKSIDLSNQPDLTLLSFGYYNEGDDVVDCEIESLDISNNTQLVDVEFTNCPKLNEVTVWSGFNVSDPASHFTTAYEVSGTTPEITYVVKP